MAAKTKKQFNEVDYDMAANTAWTKADIDTMKAALSSSYGVLPAEITYKFESITDETDDDRRSCIYLSYFMKRDIAFGGQTVSSDKDRRIFRVKMPISEDLKQKAAVRMQGFSPFNNAPALRPLALLPTKNVDSMPTPIKPKRVMLPPN